MDVALRSFLFIIPFSPGAAEHKMETEKAEKEKLKQNQKDMQFQNK